jgi:aconitate hydratase A / 2-methylisocitrate dehydratase
MEKQEFLSQITIGQKLYSYYDISVLEGKGFAVKHLPFSIRILIENLLRNLDDEVVKEKDLSNICHWQKYYKNPVEIPFHPSRVLMQDFTGVPAVVDLAAMRDAIKSLGGNPERINPLIPVELIVDHSIQVDYYGTDKSLEQNVAKEYERNAERYSFLKWAQMNFNNFKVVPPNSGICHQVNLEYLARVICAAEQDDALLLYPDTLVGTDSHTTMINGSGVMGWGVGGIEAEAVMLGQPYFMSIPEVVGVRLTGELKPGVTTTDLTLTITQILRRYNVVEKFVEFFGEGSKNLTVPDRATIANMSPEYGATMGFFPVDEKTIEYLEMTNRAEQARITEAYTKKNGMFCTGEHTPQYTDIVDLDLSSIEPSLAGPSRPQDRVAVSAIQKEFTTFLDSKQHDDASLKAMSQFFDESGSVTSRQNCCLPCKNKKTATVNIEGQEVAVGDGSIVIAAITSCTNTSNPFVLLGAGLLAKNAVQKGLKMPNHVKTSLAPGSKVVVDYLESAGLMPYLEALGFYLTGFGCTTCIGNSGPLHPNIEKAITDKNLSVAAILSGNRNFEARIHQKVKVNFLASPMLVVAFALCGRIDVDLETQSLGMDLNGAPVYLRDIWPDNSEIQALVAGHVKQELFQAEYAKIFDGDDFWRGLEVFESTTFPWDKNSNYIKNPPYFSMFDMEVRASADISNARALLLVGDSVTTDHISPAGAIHELYPAGQYLLKKGVRKEMFNSYGSRRGNHEVMIRGTFGNIRIKNHILNSKEGSFTLKFPENEEMYVYDAALRYQSAQTPLVVLAGREYGTGSSRDWAAKGTALLGIKVVIAESYERIHRSNLVGMGVLPLQFMEGESWKSLNLNGSEIFSIIGMVDMKPQGILEVKALKADGSVICFEVISRLNTDIDVKYFEHGGILPYVLRKLIR